MTPPTNRRAALGRWGEDAAATYLQGLGCTVLARNWRSPYGEIDLIVQQAAAIVFIEVKTRASANLGPPEISLNRRKQNHLRSAVEHYIQQHPAPGQEWRVDLITIEGSPAGAPPVITHFENVLTG